MWLVSCVGVQWLPSRPCAPSRLTLGVRMGRRDGQRPKGFLMALLRFKSASAAVVLTTGLALSACGSSGDAPASAPARSSVSAAVRHNAADVGFAQAMIIHHRQGVQVAGMAPTRASSAKVKALASTIQAADQPQINTLTGWLHAWDAPVPAADVASDDSGDPSADGGAGATTSSGQTLTIVGLMDAEAVIELGNGHGRAWDEQFLQDMSTFQGGALHMSEAELADGVNAGARALAQQIVVTERAEVTQMQQLMAR